MLKAVSWVLTGGLEAINKEVTGSCGESQRPELASLQNKAPGKLDPTR